MNTIDSNNKDYIEISVEEHNELVATTRRDHQTFESSQKDSNCLGGVCPLKMGFENGLKRFFSEVLVEDIVNCSNTGQRWMDHSSGVVASHRSMRRGGGYTLGDTVGGGGDIAGNISYIRHQDTSLAVENIKPACRQIINNTMSLEGIVRHCENLGHAEIEPFEGLTVDLLPFQRQSVQWALERETMEGGIQSLLWLKLPKVAEHGKVVYYNPILETFRTDKPRLVRGGIIGEEMGLGKTIISLSLILVNPAPAVPASGSDVTALDGLDNSQGVTTWNKDLYRHTQGELGAKPKKGKIISRGTLVICPVSLVGQWVEEAKRRLQDPGLVYSYHGQSRKRDPNILCEKSIVVTTPDILRSDREHHKKKSNDPENYVAPIEQIRWWRLICDEAHATRSKNKADVVNSIVADHKWLVSGTPISTSLVDLKNQLYVIGIPREEVTAMFSKFGQLLSHIGDRERPRSRRWSPSSSDGRLLGHFMFLIRSIMMRHAQGQVYRGTNPPTTLMSLPKKTERVVELEWSTAEEKDEYAVLESDAQEYYSPFRGKRDVGKYYSQLVQKLNPMRIASAGGHLPLADSSSAETDEDDEGENLVEDEDEETSSKKKKKKVVKYSDFAFSTKAKWLIAELTKSREEDETSKSLVFSQFASSLKYLQEELPKHGFQYRTLSGDMSMKKRAKALRDFQQDPPTTVFLLSMRAGACGINLTQANRVYLLEPCVNPALEKQAIGRVFRLGQTRPVEITRIIMKDTVESRLKKLLDKKYGENNNNNNGSGSGSTSSTTTSTSKKGSAASTMVGSVNVDKAEILGAEFDLLFGYDDDSEAADADDNDASNDTEMEDLNNLDASGEGGDSGDADMDETGVF